MRAVTRAGLGTMNRNRLGGGGRDWRAFLLFGGEGLALDITGAAFAFQHFVVLASHKSLLCSLNAVWYSTL